MKAKTNKLKIIKLLSFTFVTTIILVTSCTKQFDKQADINAHMLIGNGIPYQDSGFTVLGEPKQNPYTVVNMTSAWQALAAQGVVPNTQASVHTTHYYVKFKPQNLNQYEALAQDTTLALSDFPIESTVVVNGDKYHDPSLPDSVPTYQYTAVKVGYNFPDSIPYEIITNLYIPEDDQAFQYENGGSNDIFVDKLLNRAYIQTSNYEDTISIDNNVVPQSYTPGGRIQVTDTRLNTLIGMEGVRVQARRWFIILKASPDYNGYYRMKYTYKRPCNYSIWFATLSFSIREHFFGLTFWINGPKQKGDWNYTLNNSYQRFAGHVFRGAWRYNYKNIGGLSRPNILRRQSYLALNGYTSPGVNWQFAPIIKIGRYNNSPSAPLNSEYGSDEIFSTTCHETAHTTHLHRMTGGLGEYIHVSRQIQESWPVAVEWFITHLEYAERGIANYGDENYNPPTPPNYPNVFAYQYWNPSFFSDQTFAYRYTPLFIDIVDNFNEQNQFFPNFNYGIVNDNVSGYTLPYIEQNLLKHCYDLSSLATQLKNNKPIGVTDLNIDVLLSHF
ncbi:MAG: hypothetical protein ABIW38_15415 [Ferruginibacter sp.]